MLAGWVTYDELKLITNFNARTLTELLHFGLKHKCIKHQSPFGMKDYRHAYKHYIYNLADLEKCLNLFLYRQDKL